MHMDVNTIEGVEMGKLGDEQQVYTLDEIAEFLRVPRAVIEGEIQAGRLLAVEFNGDWRIFANDLQDYLLAKKAAAGKQAPQQKMQFKPGAPFTYKWPDKSDHKYDKVFEAVTTIKGKGRKIVVGFGKSGKPGNRQHAVVFVDGRPMVKFRAADDKDSELMLSIIKVADRRQLRPGDTIPAEYRDFRIEEFRKHIEESHASRNLAVVCAKDDYDSMAKHALIRASQIEGRG